MPTSANEKRSGKDIHFDPFGMWRDCLKMLPRSSSPALLLPAKPKQKEPDKNEENEPKPDPRTAISKRTRRFAFVLLSHLETRVYSISNVFFRRLSPIGDWLQAKRAASEEFGPVARCLSPVWRPSLLRAVCKRDCVRPVLGTRASCPQRNPAGGTGRPRSQDRTYESCSTQRKTALRSRLNDWNLESGIQVRCQKTCRTNHLEIGDLRVDRPVG